MTPETQNDLLGMIWQKGDWSVALRQTQELKDLLDEAGLEACFHQLQAMPERVARIKFHHHEGLWALPAWRQLGNGLGTRLGDRSVALLRRNGAAAYHRLISVSCAAGPRYGIIGLSEKKGELE